MAPGSATSHAVGPQLYGGGWQSAAAAAAAAATGTSAGAAAGKAAHEDAWDDVALDAALEKLIAASSDGIPTVSAPVNGVGGPTARAHSLRKPAAAAATAAPPPVRGLAGRRVFVPTTEWQRVETDHVLPVGLEIRMSFESGLSEARLRG